MLQFGIIKDKNIPVFYFERVRDSKLVEYNVQGSTSGIISYDTYLNNLHIELTFDWDKYK